MKTKICDLFGINYPIISGGMVWCSGWRLAEAVSRAGGLGLIGAGSMTPELLEEHIVKCRKALGEIPFGVNLPLFNPLAEKMIEVIENQEVRVVFSSGGNPALYTKRLKESGCKVAHVVASVKFALKAECAGVDAVVCEGFEAGGHNGKEELTTMVLTPQVARAVSIPVIAAGGIATGDAVLAAFALGAEGVQMGTRFALSEESSAHENFKKLCITLGEGDTMLALKKLTPVRLIKNDFYKRIAEAESRGASAEELLEIIGFKRTKLGIFEGDLNEGELEIGQITSIIRSIQTVQDVFNQVIEEYEIALSKLPFHK
ncbi:Enoyl-[acyl-carrier-protein] reductase (FMN) [Mucinivorans hirudinis]|uniref:Enoyl-[acyl-carrier-protein] reductase (FMN) n=1 Tax=Mucinivorans hirudinis TaxID=1433126 RepID=A0A060RAH2_9BACT|nr:Enoyl-[acyl-carrier-protein] reductase (FMN) [Mucinivorans hirudinis]